MALEQMEGFELAGRTVSLPLKKEKKTTTYKFVKLRVNTVHEKGQIKYMSQDSLEENGGSYYYKPHVP